MTVSSGTRAAGKDQDQREAREDEERDLQRAQAHFRVDAHCLGDLWRG